MWTCIFLKIKLLWHPSILIKLSTDQDNSVNIDAKNMILPSLESPALRLFNRNLTILLASIFMKLFSFEYRALILYFIQKEIWMFDKNANLGLAGLSWAHSLSWARGPELSSQALVELAGLSWARRPELGSQAWAGLAGLSWARRPELGSSQAEPSRPGLGLSQAWNLNSGQAWARPKFLRLEPGPTGPGRVRLMGSFM